MTEPQFTDATPEQPAPPVVEADTPPARGKRPTTRAGRREYDAARKREPKDKAPRAPRPARSKPLKPRLLEAIGGVGLVVSVVHAGDGQAILAGAENLAGALDNLAQENDAVKRALEAALTGSAWGGVIIATAAIALPIMANHGMVPEQLGAMATVGGEALPPQQQPAA